MKTTSRFFVLAGALACAAAVWGGPLVQAIGTSRTVGDGNLTVPITQSNGWGFQIFNDSSTNWLASNASDFCPSSVTMPPCDSNVWFLAGVDTFGPYTDRFGPNFVVVGPMLTVTQPFAGTSGAGSIALTRAGINVGDQQSGQLIFVYDIFDGDPNAGGNQIGGDQFAYASVTVTAGPATPEPSTLWLIGAGLAACAAKKPWRLSTRTARVLR